jgi:para-nitrobenzyl esterase
MKGVVEVRQGRLRGVRRGDLWSFSGIPYARAPVGPLRWRPPTEAERWDGIRDASTFGPIAPQSASVAGITSPSDPDNSEPHSEDCLSLNVWTPALPGPSPSRRDEGRPVMVFIHGGGFTSGSGSVFLYRGGSLVRNGDGVVVTLNYRLGALGFLGHRGLSDADGHIGNWGLHDQVAALKWVRDNIAVFGGDPQNVTIFGESAGAFSVAALLGAPAAAGLFRRAIVQSGGAYAHSVEEAERAATRLAAVLGVAESDRESLERIPAAELVAATEEIGRKRPDPGLLPLPFLPTVDGTFLPRHPLQAAADGAATGVDLLIGTNRDEMTLFGLGNPALQNMDESGVERWTANALPRVPANEVMECYREARSARSEPVEPRDIWVAAATDIVFRWPSLQFAAAHVSRGNTAFVYLFDWESPAFDGILGSCHALELPFVFGAVHVPVVQLFSGGGPTVDALSQQMQQAWLSFAKVGNPSHDGIAPWKPWDPAGRATMIFGSRTRLEHAPRDEELALLERYRPLPGSGVRATQN